MADNNSYLKLVRETWGLIADDKKTSAWAIGKHIMVSMGSKKTGKLWRGISAERQEAIYDHVVDEYKPVLIDSLKSTLREQIEDELRGELETKAKELETKALAKARKSAVEEMASQKPTVRQRDAFRHFVQETEVDCQAQAVVASAAADRHTAELAWARRLRALLPTALFLGLWPALYGIFVAKGTWATFEMPLALLAFLSTLLLVLGSNRRRYEKLEQKAKDLYKVASNYLVLGERAKTFRIVHAEKLETKKRIDELTNTLRGHKNELDHEFHPSVKDLDEARESVRHRIIDPIRIDHSDFDERLAEAQAEAQAEVAEAEASARVGG